MQCININKKVRTKGHCGYVPKPETTGPPVLKQLVKDSNNDADFE